jgi:mRNA interferase MazF
MRRGEIWLVDLGYVAKVRPVLVMSVPPGDNDRALVSYVTRTTSVRGTNYEVEHRQRGMKAGAFDAQGIGTTDQSHFIRRLGVIDAPTMEKGEDALKSWLALQ